MTKPITKVALHPVQDASVSAPEAVSTSASEVAVSATLTVAETIWADIKDKPIEMFGLANQTPAKYCKPIMIEPTKLYLTLTTTATALLPAIETAFKHRYDVEGADRFIVLSNKTAFPFKK